MTAGLIRRMPERAARGHRGRCRAGCHGTTGAPRDMGRDQWWQLTCLVAMEPLFIHDTDDKRSNKSGCAARLPVHPAAGGTGSVGARDHYAQGGLQGEEAPSTTMSRALPLLPTWKRMPPSACRSMTGAGRRCRCACAPASVWRTRYRRFPGAITARHQPLACCVRHAVLGWPPRWLARIHGSPALTAPVDVPDPILGVYPKHAC